MRHPPKYLISIAGTHAIGREVPFSGFVTSEAVRFLERRGFKAVGEGWDDD